MHRRCRIVVLALGAVLSLPGCSSGGRVQPPPDDAPPEGSASTVPEGNGPRALDDADRRPDADTELAPPEQPTYPTEVLRWRLGSVNDDGYGVIEALELLEPSGQIRWNWPVAPDESARLGKLKRRADAGRDPRKAWLVEWQDSHVLLVDPIGARRLSRTSGEPLATWSAPPVQEKVLWFDGGKFEVDGEWSCTGDARHGAFAARCDGRIVVFDGHTLTVLDADSLQVLAHTTIAARNAEVSQSGAKTDAVLRIPGARVTIRGLVYMR